MEQELFNPQSSSVSSSRVLYTPSVFARTSLIHLQEVFLYRLGHSFWTPGDHGRRSSINLRSLSS